MCCLNLIFTGAIFLVAFVITDRHEAQSIGCCEPYCYGTDNERPQSLHFSSKTAYMLAHGKDSEGQYVVPDCTPVKFWLLARHGTRMPDAKGMQKLRDLTKIRDEIVRNHVDSETRPDRGTLCDEDLDLLRNWIFDTNITDEKSHMLTTQGWDDLRYIAEHFQLALPNLFESNYSPEKYKFKYTTSDRTNDSMKAFMEGLFGDQAYEHIGTPLPTKDDILLKPYNMCPAYDTNADATEAEDSEVSKFAKGTYYQQLLQDVSQRLGFNYTLQADEINTLFDACRYEQAWVWDQPSAWCSAFTQSQVDILEYAEDLKYFNDVGYANPKLTTNLACSAVSDMLHFIESDEPYKVAAYFAHSASVQLFLTALGAGRDDDLLRADNYAEMGNRKYRTSNNTPFAANVAAIKYDCPKDNDHRTKVMLVLNQKRMELSFCKDGLCNWADLKTTYAHFDGADCADIFCSGVSRIGISFWLVIVVVVIVFCK